MQRWERRGGALVWLQLLHWLSAQRGGDEGERERERESWGRRAVLLLGDRECPLVASANNSTSAGALPSGEQSAGSAEDRAAEHRAAH